MDGKRKQREFVLSADLNDDNNEDNDFNCLFRGLIISVDFPVNIPELYN